MIRTSSSHRPCAAKKAAHHTCDTADDQSAVGPTTPSARHAVGGFLPSVPYLVAQIRNLKFDPGKHLTRDAIQVTANGLVVVYCSKTKTLQFKLKVLTLPVAAIPLHPLCPRQAFTNMCRLLPAPGDAPAFMVPSPDSGFVSPTHASFDGHLKSLLEAAGFPSSRYSGHSFRPTQAVSEATNVTLQSDGTSRDGVRVTSFFAYTATAWTLTIGRPTRATQVPVQQNGQIHCSAKFSTRKESVRCGDCCHRLGRDAIRHSHQSFWKLNRFEQRQFIWTAFKKADRKKDEAKLREPRRPRETDLTKADLGHTDGSFLTITTTVHDIFRRNRTWREAFKEQRPEDKELFPGSRVFLSQSDLLVLVHKQRTEWSTKLATALEVVSSRVDLVQEVDKTKARLRMAPIADIALPTNFRIPTNTLDKRSLLSRSRFFDSHVTKTSRTRFHNFPTLLGSYLGGMCSRQQRTTLPGPPRPPELLYIRVALCAPFNPLARTHLSLAAHSARNILVVCVPGQTSRMRTLRVFDEQSVNAMELAETTVLGVRQQRENYQQWKAVRARQDEEFQVRARQDEAISAEPRAGPSKEVDMEEPQAGPSGEVNMEEPQAAGPSGEVNMEEPQAAGPSGEVNMEEPQAAGPSGEVNMEEPQAAGPSGEVNMEEPQAGPSGEVNMEEPQAAGPSGEVNMEEPQAAGPSGEVNMEEPQAAGPSGEVNMEEPQAAGPSGEVNMEEPQAAGPSRAVEIDEYDSDTTEEESHSRNAFLLTRAAWQNCGSWHKDRDLVSRSVLPQSRVPRSSYSWSDSDMPEFRLAVRRVHFNEPAWLTFVGSDRDTYVATFGDLEKGVRQH
ncbi:hypothetical protein Bbelb_049190 [Branchiostoma belcheri]|nr:hypothetical protein Bbelb_049190 [Branchiostoma belcheri]